MKIMFFGFAVSNHTRRWVNSLSKRGHEVLLVSQPDKRDDENSISANVTVHYLKYAGKLGYFFNVPEVKQLYHKFKPDIVNAHFATGYATTVRLAGLKPVVISCWGSDVYEFPYKSFLHKKLLRANLNYANAIASTSFAMAEQTRKILDEPNKDIHVTPFGVDVDLFKPLRKEQNDEYVVGIVKYLEPIYDIELLIKAFAIVTKKFDKKIRLDIYGGGSLKSELEKLATRLDIRERVFFYGTIPNIKIPIVLHDFDVFVNCSKQESFGVAVVEAMACGLPVVVTDTPGYREIVSDGLTGFVLPDRRPETMANRILHLLNNRELAIRMGDVGREYVLMKYNWDENVSNMIRLFQSLIKEEENYEDN